jgi:hypothetical protein
MPTKARRYLSRSHRNKPDLWTLPGEMTGHASRSILGLCLPSLLSLLPVHATCFPSVLPPRLAKRKFAYAYCSVTYRE